MKCHANYTKRNSCTQHKFTPTSYREISPSLIQEEGPSCSSAADSYV